MHPEAPRGQAWFAAFVTIAVPPIALIVGAYGGGLSAMVAMGATAALSAPLAARVWTWLPRQQREPMLGGAAGLMLAAWVTFAWSHTL